jgi:ABC-type Zn uptake system ZnuABC Zn-binding protein ZnuA
VVYENGHGLQELAKHQKKIKEDKRRIELTLETVSTKLSETIEAKSLVEQAFLKLKEETGTSPPSCPRDSLTFPSPLRARH